MSRLSSWEQDRAKAIHLLSQLCVDINAAYAAQQWLFQEEEEEDGEEEDAVENEEYDYEEENEEEENAEKDKGSEEEEENEGEEAIDGKEERVRMRRMFRDVFLD